MQHNRFVKIIAFFACGILYALFVIQTGVGIPCMFKKITGLYCPGCGITRMMTSILQLRLYEAFRSNIFIFCVWPLIVAAMVLKMNPIAKILGYVLSIAAILFGVLRNIFPIFAPIQM